MFARLYHRMFSDKGFWKTLLAVAIPIMLQNLLSSSVNFVDTIMIGALGDEEVAAVGVSNQLYSLYNVAVYGLSSGLSVFLSQFYGKGDRKNIHKVMGFGFLHAAALGVVMTLLVALIPRQLLLCFTKDELVIGFGREYLRIMVFSYLLNGISYFFSAVLRCVGKASLPMFAGTTSILTNVFLNWVFIFGNLGAPALGVTGAALATVIARVLEFCMVMFFAFRPSSELRGEIHEFFGWSGKFLKTLYITLAPVVSNEFLWILGVTSCTAAFGRIGTTALASVNIAKSINELFLNFTFSIGCATLVVIGAQVGKGDRQAASDCAFRITVLSGFLGLILGSMVWLVSKPVLNLYDITEATRAAGVLVLRAYAVSDVVRAINSALLVGILRGAGDVKYACISEISCMWVLGVPLAFLGALVFKMPVQHVVILTISEEVAKMALGLWRLRSGKWIHELTHQL